jgi:2',3'-cyclic-nucleotide 2'-phosphodiesterase (5'-nucleotidase family)
MLTRNAKKITMALTRRLFAAAVLTLILVSAGSAESSRVTFLLVNDIYLMGDQLMPDGKRRGGFARLAAVVKAERAKARTTGSHVILAHGGDTLSPSLMSGIDKGAHVIALTNMVAPDIFVPGNHEFDFGKSIFLQRMAEAKFPLYAANLRGADGTPLPSFKDRSIVTLDGVRIGVTGATYDDSPRASSPQDLQFAPAIATIKEQAETLRREGADFVVSVVHADRRQDYDIMATRAVDLLLSGHDHDLFINYDGRTAAVESSYDAIYVTAIDVAIDVKVADGRRVTTWWPQFRVIDTAELTPDPEVAAAVAAYERELNRDMDVPIGVTALPLDSRTATMRSREAAIGNIVADAMRAAAHADVAIMNGGGIRGGKLYAANSPISRRDVLAELPFGNRVVTLDISGHALKAAIENGLSQLPNASGRFPQVSGLVVEADLDRPPGSRITSIKVGDAPLDEARTYRVATNDFLARGGDGYAMFAGTAATLPDSDAPPVAGEVIEYIKSVGTLRTGVEGRIVVK